VATLGGWRAAAAYAGVPEKITGIREKEMIQQTKPLREDARRPEVTSGRMTGRTWRRRD